MNIRVEGSSPAFWLMEKMEPLKKTLFNYLSALKLCLEILLKFCFADPFLITAEKKVILKKSATSCSTGQ